MAVGAVVCSPGTVSSWGRHMGVAGCVITCSVFVNLIHRLEKLEMSNGQYGAGLALSAVMRMVGHSPEDPAPGCCQAARWLIAHLCVSERVKLLCSM